MIELLEPRDRFESIRIVHLEGEQIYRSDFDAFCQHFGAGSVLVNRLAATETGTIRWCFLDRSSQFSGSRIPVGYSIPDKEAILCDDSNNPVTAGEIGQILVRSQYLALGYWRRPELTASVFTMEPNGLRTYATGDLGRLSNEGVLECLDRKDFQIKIRGNRIEAGEVEAVLLATPGVREAVVVAEGDRSDNRELLAYVVRDTISSLSARDLREYAAARLPGHMVPEGFVFIDGALPRTPNGKVDRLSLPKPTVRESLESNALPRTPIEHEVARIWAQALRRDQVGINEEFLELGGHSLAAMQIIARINNKYGVELKLRSFIGPFTVAATALEISQQMAAMTDQETLEQLLAEVGISPGKESGTSGLD
jgi:acyl carrier protein